MKKFEYTITDPLGIHARPAGMLAKIARGFKCECTVSSGGRSARLTQLIQLMSMGIKHGDTITLAADGPDEEAAATAIMEFLRENL